MALDHYEGPADIQINGRTMAEARSIDFSVLGNKRRVYTMKKGLAGRSRGPVECEATIEFAVPKAGHERDWYGLCVDDADITLVFVDGGKRIQVSGWIESVRPSRSTDREAGLSMEFVGGKPRIR